MLLSAFLIFNVIDLLLSLPVSKFRYVEMNRQIREGKQQVVGTHLLTHIQHPMCPGYHCQRSQAIRTKLKNNFLISFCIFSVAVLWFFLTYFIPGFFKTQVPLCEWPWFCLFLVIQNGPFLPRIFLIVFHHDTF